MKNLIIAAVAVTAFTFATTNSADASPRVRRSFGHSQFSFGGNGWNVSIGGHGYRNNYRNYNLHTRPVYRPVHNDYQPIHNNYRQIHNNYQPVHYNSRPNRWNYNLH